MKFEVNFINKTKKIFPSLRGQAIMFSYCFIILLMYSTYINYLNEFKLFAIFILLSPLFLIGFIKVPYLALCIYAYIGTGFSQGNLIENTYILVQYPLIMKCVLLILAFFHFSQSKDALNSKVQKIYLPYLILFVFAFYGLLSTFWTLNFEFGIYKANDFILEALFMALLFAFIRDEEGLDRLMVFTGLTSFLLSILSIVSIIIGSGYTVGGFDKNIFSRFILFSILAIKLYGNEKIFRSTEYLIYIIICVIGIFASGSRGTILVGMVAVLVSMGLKKIIITFISIISTIFVFYNTQFTSFSENPIYNTFHRTIVELVLFSSSLDISDLKTILLRIEFVLNIKLHTTLEENIFGLGWGSFGDYWSNLVEFTGRNIEPHNILVEQYIESGMIGVLFLISIFVYYIRIGGLLAICHVLSMIVTGSVLHAKQFIWFYALSLVILRYKKMNLINNK